MTINKAEICGTCRYNHWDDHYEEHICENEESVAYGLETAWDDWCLYWEEEE